MDSSSRSEHVRCLKLSTVCSCLWMVAWMAWTHTCRAHTYIATLVISGLNEMRDKLIRRLRTWIQSFFSSSVLQTHKIESLSQLHNALWFCVCTHVCGRGFVCVCVHGYLACSSRDLCFPDTRNVLGTATLLVSFSWKDRHTDRHTDRRDRQTDTQTGGTDRQVKPDPCDLE